MIVHDKLHNSMDSAMVDDKFLIDFLVSIYERSQPEVEEDIEVLDDDIHETDEDSDFDRYLESEMAKNLTNPVMKTSSPMNIRDKFIKEVNNRKENGIRGEKLSFVYYSLMSIQCTSTESERNFSAAGLIVNKLSTRLADRSI